MLKAPSLPKLRKFAVHEHQAAPGPAALPPVETEGNLLPWAFMIMAAAYAVGLMSLAALFLGHTEALFAVTISILYAVMYFGMPVMLQHQKNRHDPRESNAMWQGAAAKIRTLTGTINRSEALLQMVLVPVLVAIFFIAFSIIWLTVA